MANERARQLRKSMTRQEVKLWVHLRSWRSQGYHFRRQAPRDGRVLDFVCLRHRLIVEVDGGQHNFEIQMANDRKRDEHFTDQGFKVLRFWNNEVERNLPGVLQAIRDELIRLDPPPRHAMRADPPPSGEG